MINKYTYQVVFVKLIISSKYEETLLFNFLYLDFIVRKILCFRFGIFFFVSRDPELNENSGKLLENFLTWTPILEQEILTEGADARVAVQVPLN